MRIIYDWRLARVVDAEGITLDELVWERQSTGALVDRLANLQSGRMSHEARVLANRFEDAEVDSLGALSAEDWPEESAEEIELFTEASSRLAKRGVADSSADIDRRLEMLVSSANELRSAWTTSEARCVEWVGLFLSEVDLDGQRDAIPAAVAKSISLDSAAEILNVSLPPHKPDELEWNAIFAHANGVVNLGQQLSEHEDAIRAVSYDYVPSLSKLIGPLGAAKLLVLAGGRERLARMPSGSLQVLGASAAMSAHRRGAPPPKHGAILFSMPAISRSPRWVRGKIARYLAGKASIAVRVDHFGGEPWSEEKIAEIHKETEAIKARFPKPPSRK